ncbi:hypothetical protein T4E_8525 [Trichinella pseudospiralis]|uniref:Secreted protein n=1 Tax=Trichinella pseudospiralis TaxID=6337 RepID=A0A0V0XHQ3_TRIPS|nr:hypothetical protein T4E_8525 [Trichinella pseudospiralis]
MLSLCGLMVAMVHLSAGRLKGCAPLLWLRCVASGNPKRNVHFHRNRNIPLPFARVVCWSIFLVSSPAGPTVKSGLPRLGPGCNILRQHFRWFAVDFPQRLRFQLVSVPSQGSLAPADASPLSHFLCKLFERLVLLLLHRLMVGWMTLAGQIAPPVVSGTRHGH